ncbi:MAG: hypothetical protein IIX64_03585 [Bacteroidales bacterium]|nr:hypothetical protein [Bacteroidales bacterium]
MKTLTKFFAMAAIAVFALAACQKGDCGCEDDGTLKYGGVTYRIKTFSNGATWMVDNLCYVPEGKTVSSNPADSSGLWYPYVIENAAAKVLTDAASVQKYGLLYDYATIFGVEEVTEANFKTFEGVQGICPAGWHIPTRADYLALCGITTKADGETTTPVVETAEFYDSVNQGGSLKIAQEKGFNFVPAGYVSVTTPANKKKGSYLVAAIKDTANEVDATWTGAPSMTYYMASTPYKVNSTSGNIQFFGMMTTFTTATKSYGKLSLAYSNYLSGMSLRCVKNAN